MKSAIVLVLLVVACVGVYAYPQGKDYPIKLQPELDTINVDEYLKNERLLDLQLKCVLDQAPCDVVGRWVKPRVAAGLLGNCLMCTAKQTLDMQKILAFIQEKRPEAYRKSVEKYLKDSGIKVPAGDATTAKSA